MYKCCRPVHGKDRPRPLIFLNIGFSSVFSAMTHSNSTKFAIDEAAALAEPLPAPPRSLSPAALEFWPIVIDAKRRSAWTDSDLVIACNLCRDLDLVEKLNARLDAEGYTLVNEDSGRVYPHPASTMLDQASRRVLAATRSLQIHSLATGGRTDCQPNKNAASRQIKGTLSNVHSLIKRPQQ